MVGKCMTDFNIPETKEFMVAYTVADYNYTATTMNLHIPELMMDKDSSGSSSTVSIPSDIFKSKENIHVSTTVKNDSYVSIKVSKSFTATYKILNYDLIGGPHFPKGTRMIVFIPNRDISQALVVPFHE